MSQPNVKDLETLVKMLRKHGVTSFEGHGLKLEIEPAEQKPISAQQDKAAQADSGPTEDELLLWSVRAADGN